MKLISPFAFVTAMSVIIPAHADTDITAPAEMVPSAASDGGTVRAEKTLRGTVAVVDQRNDKVSVRLPSNETVDLNVSDGLLFNALRYGDAVRVTVKTVGGARTIIGLVRE